ncbi:hypothetical protein ACIQZG_20925 [Lysinibacillus sp. NPDC096418]|uniref:hypothetical protein n=1 Tax=Lysinibacillus sp. NPDC096418 TaxID=3364138 RepID=UPI003801E482
MKHVQALHNEFLETIRPILQASGRNNVYKVAQFVIRNVRGGIDEIELANRISNMCAKSRTIALQIWISDLKKIHQEHTHYQIILLIKFYKKRAALTELEKAYYEQLRKSEVELNGA